MTQFYIEFPTWKIYFCGYKTKTKRKLDQSFTNERKWKITPPTTPNHLTSKMNQSVKYVKMFSKTKIYSRSISASYMAIPTLAMLENHSIAIFV